MKNCCLLLCAVYVAVDAVLLCVIKCNKRANMCVYRNSMNDIAEEEGKKCSKTPYRDLCNSRKENREKEKEREREYTNSVI